jgi:uncharacterized protein YndB with AHSA1/START domain
MSSTTSQADLGEVIRDGERTGLRFVRRFDHPLEKVWAAITESDGFRAWMPCDMVGERRAGAEITLPFWPAQVEKYEIAEPVLTGRIEVWDPPRVFQWTWGGDVLRFELEPDGGATVLRFTTWLETADAQSTVSQAAGYHVCLSELGHWLDTAVARPLPDIDHLVHDLEAAYARLVSR